MAQENFEAVSRLRADHKWRSCVSRAYYAAFALASGELVQAGQTPRADYGTWSHSQLPAMVARHLLGGSAAASNLAYQLRRLYRLRLLADYQPHVTFAGRDAFEATGLMSQVFRQLRGVQ